MCESSQRFKQQQYKQDIGKTTGWQWRQKRSCEQQRQPFSRSGFDCNQILTRLYLIKPHELTCECGHMLLVEGLAMAKNDYKTTSRLLVSGNRDDLAAFVPCLAPQTPPIEEIIW